MSRSCRAWASNCRRPSTTVSPCAACSAEAWSACVRGVVEEGALLSEWTPDALTSTAAPGFMSATGMPRSPSAGIFAGWSASMAAGAQTKAAAPRSMACSFQTRSRCACVGPSLDGRGSPSGGLGPSRRSEAAVRVSEGRALLLSPSPCRCCSDTGAFEVCSRNRASSCWVMSDCTG